MQVANSHVPMMCAGDHSHVREEPWGSISLPALTGLWGVTFPGVCTQALPSPHPVLPSGYFWQQPCMGMAVPGSSCWASTTFLRYPVVPCVGIHGTPDLLPSSLCPF